MTLLHQLIQTAHQGWRQWWRHPLRALAVRHEQTEVMVPMVSLDARHRVKILSHLLELDREDRLMRFGFPATDEQIERYVNGLDFERDHIYGIFNVALRLEAMAHLGVRSEEHTSELQSH